MIYLTRDQIALIHSMIIDETGGSHGVRDEHALSSLEHSPRQAVFGKELYPTLFEKAALYARDILMNHFFIDGNKRTAMVAAGVFLENNGYQVVAPKGAIESFALKVVHKKLSVGQIAEWFKKHSKKMK